MTDKLYELLMKLPKHNLICLMNESLEEMRSYNGRSKFYCIMTSLGAIKPDSVNKIPEYIPKEQHTNYVNKRENTWKVPPMKTILECTDSII